MTTSPKLKPQASFMHICKDSLSSPEVVALLKTHLQAAHDNSPPGSVHALNLSGLRTPDISFWTVWQDTMCQNLMGFGALKEINKAHGEIKSMHTAKPYRGKGLGGIILKHLLKEARARHYTRVSLETGTTPAYTPARALYERHGFERCPPFADYKNDGFSLCMTMALTSPD